MGPVGTHGRMAHLVQARGLDLTHDPAPRHSSSESAHCTREGLILARRFYLSMTRLLSLLLESGVPFPSPFVLPEGVDAELGGTGRPLLQNAITDALATLRK